MTKSKRHKSKMFLKWYGEPYTPKKARSERRKEKSQDKGGETS